MIVQAIALLPTTQANLSPSAPGTHQLQATSLAHKHTHTHTRPKWYGYRPQGNNTGMSTHAKAHHPLITFVTGNAKKLEETKAILGTSIPLANQKIDCESNSMFLSHDPASPQKKPRYFWVVCLFVANNLFGTVPELQGEPREISAEKCRLAAAKVSFIKDILSDFLFHHLIDCA